MSALSNNKITDDNVDKLHYNVIFRQDDTMSLDVEITNINDNLK